MKTITVAGRDWAVEATGLKYIAYTLKSGKQVCKGVRLARDMDIILVLQQNNREIGAFRESTRRELIGLY